MMQAAMLISTPSDVRFSCEFTQHGQWLGSFWMNQPNAIYEAVAVPAPLQAGVLPPNVRTPGEWVVHLPLGRWSTSQRIPICPLEHPIFDTRTGDFL